MKRTAHVSVQLDSDYLGDRFSNLYDLFLTLLIFFTVDLAALLSLVQHHIPGAKLVEETRREAVIILPQTAAKDSSLGVFLSELDQRLTELGISSYGLSHSTLEEVRCRFTD